MAISDELNISERKWIEETSAVCEHLALNWNTYRMAAESIKKSNPVPDVVLHKGDRIQLLSVLISSIGSKYYKLIRASTIKEEEEIKMILAKAVYDPEEYENLSSFDKRKFDEVFDKKCD